MTATQARDYKQTAYRTAKQWHAGGGKVNLGTESRPNVVEMTPLEVLKRLVDDAQVPVDIAIRQLARFHPAARKWLSQGVNPITGASTKNAPRRSTTKPVSFTSEGPGSAAIPISYTNLGGPQAHHDRPLGNWQSDNAWDYGIPVGTPIYATADGTVGPDVGIMPSRPNDGHRLTLNGSDNDYWYGHLSRLVVKPGQRVRKGQLLGYSGTSQNGVAHLHLGVRDLGSRV